MNRVPYDSIINPSWPSSRFLVIHKNKIKMISIWNKPFQSFFRLERTKDFLELFFNDIIIKFCLLKWKRLAFWAVKVREHGSLSPKRKKFFKNWSHIHSSARTREKQIWNSEGLIFRRAFKSFISLLTQQRNDGGIYREIIHDMERRNKKIWKKKDEKGLPRLALLHEADWSRAPTRSNEVKSLSYYWPTRVSSRNPTSFLLRLVLDALIPTPPHHHTHHNPTPMNHLHFLSTSPTQNPISTALFGVETPQNNNQLQLPSLWCSRRGKKIRKRKRKQERKQASGAVDWRKKLQFVLWREMNEKEISLSWLRDMENLESFQLNKWGRPLWGVQRYHHPLSFCLHSF